MKRSVLGCSPARYQKSLRLRFIGCGLLLALTLLGNILLYTLRTAENHTIFLLINILSDILCGCFLVYTMTARLLPMLQLYRLTCRPRSTVEGTVSAIGDQPMRYMDLDCLPVTVGQRQLFLPAGTLCLNVGSHYILSVTAGLIVEVEP